MKKFLSVVATMILVISISIPITFFAHDYILDFINQYNIAVVGVLVALVIGLTYYLAVQSALRPRIKKEKSGALGKDLNIIREEMERSQRYDFNMSIILVEMQDLDELKGRYESPIETIVEGLVGHLKNLVRHSDIIMRFELNQILIILPNTDNLGSKLVSQKLASYINTSSINGFDIVVTVGYAQYFNKGSVEDLVGEASSHLKGAISQ